MLATLVFSQFIISSGNFCVSLDVCSQGGWFTMEAGTKIARRQFMHKNFLQWRQTQIQRELPQVGDVRHCCVFDVNFWPGLFSLFFAPAYRSLFRGKFQVVTCIIWLYVVCMNYTRSGRRNQVPTLSCWPPVKLKCHSAPCLHLSRKRTACLSQLFFGFQPKISHLKPYCGVL